MKASTVMGVVCFLARTATEASLWMIALKRELLHLNHLPGQFKMFSCFRFKQKQKEHREKKKKQTEIKTKKKKEHPKKKKETCNNLSNIGKSTNRQTAFAQFAPTLLPWTHPQRKLACMWAHFKRRHCSDIANDTSNLMLQRVSWCMQGRLIPCLWCFFFVFSKVVYWSCYFNYHPFKCAMRLIV